MPQKIGMVSLRDTTHRVYAICEETKTTNHICWPLVIHDLDGVARIPSVMPELLPLRERTQLPQVTGTYPARASVLQVCELLLPVSPVTIIWVIPAPLRPSFPRFWRCPAGCSIPRTGGLWPRPQRTEPCDRFP